MGSPLIHRLTIARAATGGFDDYGQPIWTWSDLTTAIGSIHPKSDREVAALTDAGVVVSDHRIILFPTDVREADRITHDQSACAVPATLDYPTVTFAVRSVKNQSGVGHHLTVEVQSVTAGGAA